MENIKRYQTYNCQECGGGGLTEDKEGPLVLFSDIKDISNTSDNNDSAEISCEVCGDKKVNIIHSCEECGSRIDIDNHRDR